MATKKTENDDNRFHDDDEDDHADNDDAFLWWFNFQHDFAQIKSQEWEHFNMKKTTTTTTKQKKKKNRKEHCFTVDKHLVWLAAKWWIEMWMQTMQQALWGVDGRTKRKWVKRKNVVMTKKMNTMIAAVITWLCWTVYCVIYLGVTFNEFTLNTLNVNFHPPASRLVSLSLSMSHTVGKWQRLCVCITKAV